MAIQTDYRVAGLHTSQVRDLQTALSVKADGAWGKISQAALNAVYGEDADPFIAFTSGIKNIQNKELAANLAAVENTAAIPLFDGTSTRTVGQMKDIHHVSGYKGQAYMGENGCLYTGYGAMLRTDGFFYPSGAKISPNGMYYDIGQGWKFAKRAIAFNGDGELLGYADNSVTGLAPGSIILDFKA